MSESNISEASTNERKNQNRDENTQARPDADPVEPSLRRYIRAFRQLRWSDRLNVVLAGLLELTLLLLLSPILLLSWLWRLFAKICTASKRRNDSAIRSRHLGPGKRAP
jgi:hypothetical protein